jgi:4-amino-4-deoxy-L-arabinose transferase-like glycosyltransferase
MTAAVLAIRRTAARPRVRTRTALIAISAIPILLYLPFLNEPLYGDEGVYWVIVRGALDGQLPYRDLFDNKPPIFYGWYAVSIGLFGEHEYGPRLLAALAMSVSTLLVYAQARMLVAGAAAFVAAGAFALSAGITPIHANATSEVFMLPPLLASLVVFTASWRSNSSAGFAAAGALGSLAVLTKQVAAWNLLALGLFALIWGLRASGALHVRLRPAVLLSAGAAAATALVLAPLVAAGIADDFIDSTVRFNQAYQESVDILDLLNAFWRIALIEVPLFAPPLVFLAAVGVIVLLRRGPTPLQWLLLLWAAGAAIGVASPGLFFLHYFVQLLPAWALLAALAFHARPYLLQPGRVRLAALAVLVWFGVLINLPAYLATTPTERHVDRSLAGSTALRENLSVELGAYIRERTEPDNTIYVHGHEASLYYYADRLPATRNFTPTPLRVLGDEAVAELVDGLRAARPAYIVDTLVPARDEQLERVVAADLEVNVSPPAFRALLAEQYEYVGHLLFADVYRLRE